MGYSADVIENSGREDGLLALILKDKVRDVYGRLLQAEQADFPGGHISWCNELASYQGSMTEVVAAVLSDFGFDGGVEVTDEGDIAIQYWGGDKLGGSWDSVLEAIALGVDPTVKLTWIMVGEDGEHWAEVFFDSQCATKTMHWMVDE